MFNRKKAAKIARILRKSANELTQKDRIELAYYRRDSGQKVSYEEFVMMLSTNDELSFECDEEVCEIIHDRPTKVTFYVSKYCDSQLVHQRHGDFSSIDDLLKEARINGKSIEEAWEKIVLH